MDIPSTVWLPDLEMEEPSHIMKQHHQTRPYYTDSVDSFSSESYKDNPHWVSVNQSIPLASINGDLDQKQDRMATKSSPFTSNYGSLSSTFTISFGNPDILTPKEETSLNEFIGSIEPTTRVQTTRRNHRQAQEHVLSERKRREKLAQRFMSLSDLLPGRKKMDKASVLEDASSYIVQLQNRVKELEERSVKGKHIIRESVVSVKRSMICVNPGDQASCSNETNKDLPSSCTFDPEIKARICGRNILLRIYCREDSSILPKTLTEMERLHITHICCSVLPLSDSTSRVITITAKMSEEIVITTKYLGECLQSALSNFP